MTTCTKIEECENASLYYPMLVPEFVHAPKDDKRMLRRWDQFRALSQQSEQNEQSKQKQKVLNSTQLAQCLLDTGNYYQLDDKELITMSNSIREWFFNELTTKALVERINQLTTSTQAGKSLVSSVKRITLDKASNRIIRSSESLIGYQANVDDLQRQGLGKDQAKRRAAYTVFGQMDAPTLLTNIAAIEQGSLIIKQVITQRLQNPAFANECVQLAVKNDPRALAFLLQCQVL